MNGIAVHTLWHLGEDNDVMGAFKAKWNIPRSLRVVNHRNHMYFTVKSNQDTVLIRNKMTCFTLYIFLRGIHSFAVPIYHLDTKRKPISTKQHRSTVSTPSCFDVLNVFACPK